MKTKILSFLTIFLINLNIIYSQTETDTIKLIDWGGSASTTYINDTLAVRGDAYTNVQLSNMNVDSFIFECTIIPLYDTASFNIVIGDSNWNILVADYIVEVNDTMHISYKFEIPNENISNFIIYIGQASTEIFNLTNLELLIYKNTNSVKNIASKTTNKQLIGIYDLLGQQVQKTEKNVVYIYQYSDGTTEKRIQIK